MCCRIEHSSWIQDIIEKVALPIIVGIFTYLVLRKFDDYKKRRDYSILGGIIIRSFIEEVKTGLEHLKKTLEEKIKPVYRLPNASWINVNTIPDEVLLRIISVSKGIIPVSFNPTEIRIHIKNYFEHMCLSWTKVVEASKNGEDWLALANSEHYNDFIEATEGVLAMLEQTKELLENNATKIFPK